MNRHVRWYRRLVRLYPRDFRERFGDEMVVLFADQLRDAQRAGRRSAILGLWVRSVVDLIATATHEHLAGRKQHAAQPANGGVTVTPMAEPGPVRWLSTLIAASPFAAWVGLSVVAPGFTDPIYVNPPGILGLPAGILAVGIGWLLAAIGLMLVRRSRSAVGSLVILAFVTLPAWIIIVCAPIVVLAVEILAI